ncbi:MAG: sigma-70 family RNA polymerase sigma factor [Chloroflexota bacterium]
MTDFRNNSRESKALVATGAKAEDRAEIAGLVSRAAGGDTEAFGRLYSIYVERIYRYAFYKVRDKMTAEDITEEVFIKAWNAIGSCRGKEKTFSPWLYRIAHNCMVDTFRSQPRQQSLEAEDMSAVSDPKLELEAGLDQMDLLEAVSSLPRNQWQVIVLKFIDGLDNREIGQVTGKKQGAIRALQMRGLATLRHLLNNGDSL